MTSPAFSSASSSASSSSGQTSFLQASHLSTNLFGNTSSSGFSLPSSSSPQLSFLQASHLNANSFPNMTSPAFSTASSPSSYQDTINPYQQHSPIKQEIMSASNSDASGFPYRAINNPYGLPSPPSSVELNPTPSPEVDGYYPSLDNAHIRITENYGPVNYTTSPTINGYYPSLDNAHSRITENYGPIDHTPSPTTDESIDDSDSQPSPLPQPPTAVNESSFKCPEILNSVLENRDGKFTPDRQLVIARVLIGMKENPELPFPEFLLYAPDHNDKAARDHYLLIAKWFKLEYRQIKMLGEFPVADTTLRGRYRAYTRPAEARPRKPAPWSEEQTQAMLMAKAQVEAEILRAKAAIRAGRREGPPPNFTWKQVGKQMRVLGIRQRFHGAAIAKQFRGVQAKKGTQ